MPQLAFVAVILLTAFIFWNGLFDPFGWNRQYKVVDHFLKAVASLVAAIVLVGFLAMSAALLFGRMH